MVFLPIILNFYKHITLLAQTYILLQLLYDHLVLHTGFLNNYDIFSRIITSDFYINSYYYLWTNFWYIPGFILTLTALLLSYYGRLQNKSMKIILIILCLCLLEVVDYWHMNTGFTGVIIDPHLINILLANSINKYHPLLLYVTLLVSVLYYVVYMDVLYSPKMHVFYINNYYATNAWVLTNALVLITFTLFLGSWWALQEGSWGGWWNWDPSEVFGMLIMVFFILTLHKCLVGNYTLINRNSLVLKSLLILMVYYFIQINFSLVSHNFGIKQTQSINPIQVFFTIFGCLLLFVQKTSSISTNYYCVRCFIFRESIYTPFNRREYLFWVVGSLITSMTLYSFTPLINDFMLQLLGVNTLNMFLGIHTVSLSITVVSLLFYYRFSLYVLVLVLGSLVELSFTELIVFIVLLRLSYIHNIHFLLTLFTLESYFAYHTTDLKWSVLNTLSYDIFLSKLTFFYLNSITLNTLNLEFFVVDGSSYTSLNSGVVSYKSSTFYETNPFNLRFKYNSTSQELLNGFFTKLFTINIYDLTIVVLSHTLSLIYICFRVINKRAIKNTY